MKYNAPVGAQDSNAPYVNGIPGVQKGSPVNANAVEYPQREIIHCIEQAGLAPTNNDLTQLYKSVIALQKGVGIGGQTWQDKKNERQFEIAYQNTTGAPIAVEVASDTYINGGYAANIAQRFEVSENGNTWITLSINGWNSSSNRLYPQSSAIVPDGYYYRIRQNDPITLVYWCELR